VQVIAAVKGRREPIGIAGVRQGGREVDHAVECPAVTDPAVDRLALALAGGGPVPGAANGVSVAPNTFGPEACAIAMIRT
jgi:hypothetical protein